MTQSCLPSIINNLVLVAGKRASIQQYQCKDFIVNLVKVLRFYFECSPEVFRNDWKNLLSSVIFPLMEAD